MRVSAETKLWLECIVWFVGGLWVLTFILNGTAKYKDVSQAYAHWVGQRCTVLKGLVAKGVTLGDLGPNQITDVVYISTLASTGPEITFRKSIRKGTDMLITSVEVCINCPFPPYPRFRYGGTLIPSVPELAPHRVFAGSDAVADDQVHCITNGPASAPSSGYELLLQRKHHLNGDADGDSFAVLPARLEPPLAQRRHGLFVEAVLSV